MNEMQTILKAIPDNWQLVDEFGEVWNIREIDASEDNGMANRRGDVLELEGEFYGMLLPPSRRRAVQQARPVVVVTDENSGEEALYIDGKLCAQDATIYAADIEQAITAAGGNPVAVHHVVVTGYEYDAWPQEYDTLEDRANLPDLPADEVAKLTTEYVHCSRCGKRVSSRAFTAQPLTIRAWVGCPECVEQQRADLLERTEGPSWDTSEPRAPKCTKCGVAVTLDKSWADASEEDILSFADRCLSHESSCWPGGQAAGETAAEANHTASWKIYAAKNDEGTCSIAACTKCGLSMPPEDMKSHEAECWGSVALRPPNPICDGPPSWFRSIEKGAACCSKCGVLVNTFAPILMATHEQTCWGSNHTETRSEPENAEKTDSAPNSAPNTVWQTFHPNATYLGQFECSPNRYDLYVNAAADPPIFVARWGDKFTDAISSEDVDFIESHEPLTEAKRRAAAAGLVGGETAKTDSEPEELNYDQAAALRGKKGILQEFRATTEAIEDAEAAAAAVRETVAVKCDSCGVEFDIPREQYLEDLAGGVDWACWSCSACESPPFASLPLSIHPAALLPNKRRAAAAAGVDVAAAEPSRSISAGPIRLKVTAGRVEVLDDDTSGGPAPLDHDYLAAAANAARVLGHLEELLNREVDLLVVRPDSPRVMAYYTARLERDGPLLRGSIDCDFVASAAHTARHLAEQFAGLAAKHEGA